MIAMPLRLRSTLALAVGGHLLIVVALRGVQPRAAAPVAAPEPIEVGLDDRLAASALPSVAETTRPVAERAGRGVMSAPARARDLVRTSGEAPVGLTTDAPAAWSFDPVQQHTAVDLGLGRNRPPATPEPAAPRTEKSAVDRSLHDALGARDLGLGLGRASVLVSAAREAASSPRAPELGTVTFEIDCDASGTVRSAHADDRAWADVGAALIHAMSGKTVRVRAGARGLRAHLRIVAERAPPSGNGGSTTLGAVPDDVPGSEKACEGTGWTRRCVAGMPLGLTSAQHDSANVGARPSRVVRVQLLDETEI